MKIVRTKIKSIITITLLLLLSSNVFSYDFEIDGICYNVINGSTSVRVTYRVYASTKYDYRGDIVIPAIVTYDGVEYNVTEIGSNAFSYCRELNSVTLPSSITKISVYAFQNCGSSLTSITIPSSVQEIGSAAFEKCTGLKSITIPDNITSLGTSIFKECTQLKKAILPKGINGINSYMFSGCSSLEEIEIPTSVKTIGYGAFSGCSNLKSIILPYNISDLWDSAFEGCSTLSHVVLETENPPTLGEKVFNNISPDAILTVPKGTRSKYEALAGWTKNFSKIEEKESGNQDEVLNGIEINGLYYNLNVKDKTATVTSKTNGEDYSGSLSIPSSVTYNGSSYTVTAIGPLAFFSNAGLTGPLTIPNTVTSIGKSAFQWCTGLTGSLIIPNSVTTIGESAFEYCRGFTGSLTIPNSVTSIGTAAFSNCRGFNGSLTISNSLTAIEDWAFYGCIGLTGSLIIPNSVTSIGDRAFYGCIGLTGSLIIPNSVTSIGSEAFIGCIGFVSLAIPSSVTSIGGGAFGYCRHLSMVESWIESPFPLTETVFQEISSNAVLRVPKGAKGKYESYAGWTKNFIQIVEEGESVNQDELLYGIEINGLYYDLNLTNNTASVTYKDFLEGNSYSGSLSIPSFVTHNGSTYNVTAISPRAFYNCSKLTGSLSIPSSVKTIGSYAFNGCTGFTGSLTIPNSVLSIGNGAFADCSGFAGSLSIPNSVLSIGSNAFKGCTGFTGSLTIPNSVLSIGSNAFKGCTGFTGSLIIPNSVTSIGGSAFAYCSGFTGSLTIPNSITELKDYVFDGCSGFTGSLKIPESVTSIGNYTFQDCVGLNGNLIIPSSVKFIACGAFKNCNHLSMVESWIISPYYITEDVFQNISSNAVLQVPNGTKGKYEAYTGWTKNFSKIVEAESPTTKYELSIKASGNGSVSYDGTTIRNITRTFTVNEGASATISFNPDNGYIINSVKVNSSDLTSNLSNNKYTISNINKNTSVEVEFQEKIKKFTANGINYTILSYDNNTINLANGNYGIVLEVPATITYQGVTWSVAGIDNNALANNNDLAAIIWNPSVAFAGSVSNPNLLLYVKSASNAPASIKNVVVNSTAESIVLTDAASGNNFYCPKEFTARKISYTHNYGMITGIGECRGWETIALPFDVKKIAHSSKGELTPFANWRSGDSRKPFWLMSYGAGGWTNANSINANTPYIISMPNNQDYKAEFKLSGNITFSAENVTVKRSDNLQTGSYNGNSFIPNFTNTNNSGYLLLNVNNDYVSYTGASTEGSTFIANLRTVHPFEAYMTSASKTRSTISINGDMTTGIEDMSVLMDESKGLRIYNLKGQLIKVEQDKVIDDVKGSLPAGVYIVNGKKLIIK